MEGREMDVRDSERRRAANAALTEIIEEVCRHYAPSGARVEDCWEVRDAGDRVALRVFLAGPMQGSWTEAAAGARGDALDLVARLSGLDAAGALAEAERFLSRQSMEPDRKAGDAGGDQMALFGPLPESHERKRPARRSARGRNAGASRRATTQHDPPPGDAVPPSGDEPAGTDEAASGSQSSPDAPEPEGGKAGPAPAARSSGAALGPGGSGQPVPDPDGIGFTADDRQLLRRSAEDAAWTRSHMTVRERDVEAHERAKARKDGHDRRRRGTRTIAASCGVLAVALPLLGVAAEERYGVMDRAALLVASLDDYARTAWQPDEG